MYTLYAYSNVKNSNIETTLGSHIQANSSTTPAFKFLANFCHFLTSNLILGIFCHKFLAFLWMNSSKGSFKNLKFGWIFQILDEILDGSNEVDDSSHIFNRDG
jgi:hypothetical protein